ncbi:hypothetical protein Lalb_Chr01g0018531 [Lupinus albus]|uniref:Uncharacterized protein n=1 Tax=Lupinus albus TaxID=3870 RepID=A0A6A4R837_LUPAL|nr:hypothetical protein Lalb_Chr01g0018531 [Lupinus albus]
MKMKRQLCHSIYTCNDIFTFKLSVKISHVSPLIQSIPTPFYCYHDRQTNSITSYSSFILQPSPKTAPYPKQTCNNIVVLAFSATFSLWLG